MQKTKKLLHRLSVLVGFLLKVLEIRESLLPRFCRLSHELSEPRDSPSKAPNLRASGGFRALGFPPPPNPNRQTSLKGLVFEPNVASLVSCQAWELLFPRVRAYLQAHMCVFLFFFLGVSLYYCFLLVQLVCVGIGIQGQVGQLS